MHFITLIIIIISYYYNSLLLLPIIIGNVLFKIILSKDIQNNKRVITLRVIYTKKYNWHITLAYRLGNVY